MPKSIVIFYHCNNIPHGTARDFSNIDIFTIREATFISDVIRSDYKTNAAGVQIPGTRPDDTFNLTSGTTAVNNAKTVPDLVILKREVINKIVKKKS
jgi:hypothetical protein